MYSTYGNFAALLAIGISGLCSFASFDAAYVLLLLAGPGFLLARLAALCLFGTAAFFTLMGAFAVGFDKLPPAVYYLLSFCVNAATAPLIGVLMSPFFACLFKRTRSSEKRGGDDDDVNDRENTTTGTARTQNQNRGLGLAVEEPTLEIARPQHSVDTSSVNSATELRAMEGDTAIGTPARDAPTRATATPTPATEHRGDTAHTALTVSGAVPSTSTSGSTLRKVNGDDASNASAGANVVVAGDSGRDSGSGNDDDAAVSSKPEWNFRVRGRRVLRLLKHDRTVFTRALISFLTLFVGMVFLRFFLADLCVCVMPVSISSRMTRAIGGNGAICKPGEPCHVYPMVGQGCSSVTLVSHFVASDRTHVPARALVTVYNVETSLAVARVITRQRSSIDLVSTDDAKVQMKSVDSKLAHRSMSGKSNIGRSKDDAQRVDFDKLATAVSGDLVRDFPIDEDWRVVARVPLTSLRCGAIFSAYVQFYDEFGFPLGQQSKTIKFSTLPGALSASAAPPAAGTPGGAGGSRDPGEVVVVGGGDIYAGEAGYALLQNAFELRPKAHILYVGGDVAYANNIRYCHLRWDDVINELSKLRRSDGTVPLLLTAVGNHEGGGYLHATSKSERQERYVHFTTYFPSADHMSQWHAGWVGARFRRDLTQKDRDEFGRNEARVNAQWSGDRTVTFYRTRVGATGWVVLDSGIMLTCEEQVAYLDHTLRTWREEITWANSKFPLEPKRGAGAVRHTTQLSTTNDAHERNANEEAKNEENQKDGNKNEAVGEASRRSVSPLSAHQWTVTDDVPLRSIVVVYHNPAFPTVRSMDNDESVAVRKHFLPLVLKYNATIVFENHDHAYKRTLPLIRTPLQSSTATETQKPSSTEKLQSGAKSTKQNGKSDKKTEAPIPSGPLPGLDRVSVSAQPGRGTLFVGDGALGVADFIRSPHKRWYHAIVRKGNYVMTATVGSDGGVSGEAYAEGKERVDSWSAPPQ